MISTLIYLSIMLTAGIMIGGIIVRSPSTWITCIIVIVVLSGIGIILRYRRDNAFAFRLRSFQRRIEKIMSDPYASAKFSSAEIVTVLINLWDAKRMLSEEDFQNVMTLFRVFQETDRTLHMDRERYLCFCTDMMAHFDLIAPYYLFCGNKDMEIAAFLEEEKEPYRRKAKRLLRRNQLFQEEWIELHSDFKSSFY